MNMDSVERAMYGDVENDEELMAELLALEAEERAAGRIPSVETTHHTATSSETSNCENLNIFHFSYEFFESHNLSRFIVISLETPLLRTKLGCLPNEGCVIKKEKKKGTDNLDLYIHTSNNDFCRWNWKERAFQKGQTGSKR